MENYVLIGASSRGAYSYAGPIASTFAHCARVVGVFDPNPLRCEKLKVMAGLDCPTYTDCDRMLAEATPDAAIITTVDRYHHEYILKCLAAGIDAITEKPMTIDAAKCKAILDAERSAGREIRVTFNCRFAPYPAAIKQAVKDGLVGDVLSVHLEYLLDTSHGADYFRRWHRRKENSGGLLVHKATHHFDLVNWWIADEPVDVMAYGARRFYGPSREARGERCMTCSHTGTCEYYLDITADNLMRIFYAECEAFDGYYRDRCVFADDIDIEDTMSVNVRYSRGALLSYSLIAHSPYEAYKVSINGTDGRIEAAEYYSGDRANEPCYTYDFFNRKGEKETISVPKATGGHGGGDERLLRMLFEGGLADPLGQQAGSYDGAVSILIGIAANTSIAEGRNIAIADLVPLAEYRKLGDAV